MFYFDKITGTYGSTKDLIIITDNNVTEEWVTDFLGAEADTDRKALAEAAVANGSGYEF